MGTTEDIKPAPLVIIDPAKSLTADAAIKTARMTAWAAPIVEKTLTDEALVREKVWRDDKDAPLVVFDGNEKGAVVTVVQCAKADEAQVRKLMSPNLPLNGQSVALGVPVEGADGLLVWCDARWSPATGHWMMARLAGVASAKCLAALPKGWAAKGDGKLVPS